MTGLSIVCSSCGMSTNDPETGRCCLPGCVGHYDLTDPTSKPPDELIDTPSTAVWVLLRNPDSPTGYVWEVKGLGVIIDEDDIPLARQAMRAVHTYQPPAYSTIQHPRPEHTVCGTCGSHVLYQGTHDEWHRKIGG